MRPANISRLCLDFLRIRLLFVILLAILLVAGGFTLQTDSGRNAGIRVLCFRCIPGLQTCVTVDRLVCGIYLPWWSVSFIIFLITLDGLGWVLA